MFVIIPTKPFEQSKTRLSPLLNIDQRSVLTRNLLLRTIKLAHRVGQVVVISRDRQARRLAKEAGAWSLVEAGNNLNNALQQATEWVQAKGGQAVLILPGDLPLLTSSDLVEMTRLGEATPSVVIAPCHRADGTNGLLLRPPGLIKFVFGENSFEKHCWAARLAGVEAVIYRSPTIAFDVDVPEDWQRLKVEFSNA
jgi:2-phospho-L-lactate guanylyltransferase